MKAFFSANRIIKQLFIAAACTASATAMAQDKPENITYCFENRFLLNESLSLDGIDSLSFGKTGLKRYKTTSSGTTLPLNKTYYKLPGVYVFGSGERTLVQPSSYYDVDFTKETSKWCFQRSMESEHFVCFWEKGLTLKNNTITLGNNSVNVKTLLNRGEAVWKKYVEELGFLIPGKSVTDKTKIIMFIVNQTDWRADGSGQDGRVFEYSASGNKAKSMKVGLFHCDPRAANSEGGHTMAHEVGHVFQYLVSADCGSNHGWGWGYDSNANGGNCWWESCAQWQAFQVFPSGTFSNYRYNEYVTNAYKNLLHEGPRYANYLIQNYWCELYGRDFIGRLWRESTWPEDPVETYKRMNNVSQDDFNKMIFDYACRAITWDIEGIRTLGKNYQNSFSTSLKWVEGTDNTYIVDPSCTPQNYGFNVIRLKGFKSGEKVKVDFKGVAGTTGYRNINKAKAGWRYGFVAQTTDGSRVYGEMSKDKEGVAEMMLPENTYMVWLVVTGAPTEHWRHPWDDDESNDEQWPYQVAFTGCSAQGTSRTYDAYPDDYVRRDTTVVLNAELAYSASNYSSVQVPYDMDAVSRALGVSTKQMQAAKCNASSKGIKGTIDFVGVNANGTYRYGTTTSTSSSTVFGHWFTTAGNVSGYDNSAAIYAEMTPSDFNCKVGQYPGHLSAGRTYTFKQAFIYTHTDGKQYKATMEVHLKVK